MILTEHLNTNNNSYSLVQLIGLSGLSNYIIQKPTNNSNSLIVTVSKSELRFIKLATDTNYNIGEKVDFTFNSIYWKQGTIDKKVGKFYSIKLVCDNNTENYIVREKNIRKVILVNNADFEFTIEYETKINQKRINTIISNLSNKQYFVKGYYSIDNDAIRVINHEYFTEGQNIEKLDYIKQIVKLIIKNETN